jgi:molybdopterin molybdotransferase
MSEWQELDWDRARELAGSICDQLASEVLPLENTIDRFLGQDYMALCDLPTFTTSSMDGWAVAGKGPWKIVGDVKAGAPYEKGLESGTTVRIATGAVIPQGTFGIVRWEVAKVDNEYVHAQVNEGADIRPAGEECREGDLLAKKGTRLTPALIGLLAACGHDRIEVIRKPRVALLLLGDELLLSGLPHSGRVRDSLGPQLPGWLDRLGTELVSTRYVTDELSSVIEALSQSLDCDLVITTGGTADGPRDHVHNALDSLNASLVVDRVRSRPGHPMLLAKIPHRGKSVPLLGLPGNPQSAIVGLMSLGAPVIDSLLGRNAGELETVITQTEIFAPKNFTRLVLGNLVQGRFEMGEHLGSAMLRGLAASRGFAVASSGITPVGGQVRWLPLPQ